MSAFFTLPGIITFLVLTTGLYGTYRLFLYLLARDRRQVIGTVTPEVAQRHRALIYLIRGSESLILVPLLLVVVLIFAGFFLSIIDSINRDTLTHGRIYSIALLLGVFLMIAAVAVRLRRRIFKSRRELFQNFQSASTTNVSNFAFIFAAFTAHDFYRLMRGAASADTSHLSTRDSLWPFIFFGVWLSLKVFLNILLELPPSRPSQDPPDDRHIPEFPQKSPLLPL